MHLRTRKFQLLLIAIVITLLHQLDQIKTLKHKKHLYLNAPKVQDSKSF